MNSEFPAWSKSSQNFASPHKSTPTLRNILRAEFSTLRLKLFSRCAGGFENYSRFEQKRQDEGGCLLPSFGKSLKFSRAAQEIIPFLCPFFRVPVVPLTHSRRVILRGPESRRASLRQLPWNMWTCEATTSNTDPPSDRTLFRLVFGNKLNSEQKNSCERCPGKLPLKNN